MAAYSGFITGTCSVNSGTKNVTVTLDAGSSAIEEIASGTAIFINDFPPVEAVGGSGTTVTLAENWPHANQVTQVFTTIYTIEGLRDASTYARQAAADSLALASSFNDLLTSTTPTIVIGNAPNDITLTPYQYLVDQFNIGLGDVDAIKNGSVAPSKAEFLARHKGVGSGFVHWGKHFAGEDVVNEGIWQLTTVSDSFFMGRTSGGTGVSTTIDPRVRVNSSDITLNLTPSGATPTQIKLPPAPDGLDKRDGTGRYTDLTAAISSGGVGLTESMINASDITILRSPVIPNDIASSDKVYPNSLKQFGATSLDGVSTTTTELNPMWTDAIFTSDDTTAYKCWAWAALSDANKAIIRNNPNNNIYSDNGALKQRTLEAFTHRINNADFAGDINNLFDIMAAIGATFDEDGFKFTYNDGGVDYEVIGVDQCSRFNQGAYHPEFNPNGCGAWANINSNFSMDWYSSAAAIGVVSSTSQAFNVVPENAFNGQTGVRDNTGSIVKGAGHAKRPNSSLYDAIEAGQIKDLRIDASGTHTPQTAHHTLSKRARNGEARGWEKQPFIRSQIDGGVTTATTTAFALKVAVGSVTNLGSWLTASVQDASGWLLLAGVKHKIHSVKDDGSHVFLYSYTLPAGGYNTGSTAIEAVFGDYIDAPYSEGLFQNITGTPAEIAATFSGGVMGEWIPVIPDGTSKEYKSTKKNLEQYQSLLTSDSGVNWANDAATTEGTSNSYTVSQTAAQVRIIPFRAKANFTEEMAIDGVEFLYGNMGTEYNTKYLFDWGAVLAQSLTNVIPTDTTAGRINAFLSFSLFYPKSQFETYITAFSQTSETVENTIHSSATSDGVQWETRVTSQDNLASLIIPYRQIKHDGATYGAGLTFGYVDNTSNALDDNGELIQVGTARSLDDMNIILRENFNV